MPRDILVNGRCLSRRITGVERYAREILRRFPVNYRIEMTNLNGGRGHAWEQFILPTKLRRDSILWSPANTGPILIRNQVLTLQDLSALEHPEWFKRGFAAWYRILLPILIKRVRAVITPSEYVRQKVLKRFPGVNALAIPSGVNAEFFHPGARRRSLPELPKRYILFVGSLEPRKNLPALLNAWNQIRREFPEVALVIAGGRGSVFRAIDLPVGGANLFYVGHMDAELPALYADADLFVLPSFDEGFGLPALEAMACGTPVIVSNGGALPEVVGDAGFIFDLSAPDTLAQSMQECLTDKNLRASLIEKGLARVKQFSWQNTATEIWKTLNEL
jgi:glycosyltransferase involved in cell wall biosynthesis